MTKLKVKAEPKAEAKPAVKSDKKSSPDILKDPFASPPSFKASGSAKRPRKCKRKKKKLSAAAREALRERLARPLAIAKPLAQLLGVSAVSRAQAVAKLWEYIRSHGLKDKKDGRLVVCDDALKSIFGGVEFVHILAIPQLLTPLFKVASQDVPSTIDGDMDDSS